LCAAFCVAHQLFAPDNLAERRLWSPMAGGDCLAHDAGTVSQAECCKRGYLAAVFQASGISLAQCCSICSITSCGEFCDFIHELSAAGLNIDSRQNVFDVQRHRYNPLPVCQIEPPIFLVLSRGGNETAGFHQNNLEACPSIAQTSSRAKPLWSLGSRRGPPQLILRLALNLHRSTHSHWRRIAKNLPSQEELNLKLWPQDAIAP
jgi:hypothetical protein